MEIGEAQKQYEILHIGDYDVVLNNTARDQESVRRLAEEIRKNIERGKSPLDGWVQDSENERLSVDNKDKPTYLAKERWADGAVFIERMEYINRLKDPIMRENIRRVYFGYNSIVNEMLLVSKIRSLINSDEAQGIAKRYGCISIKFAEPLVGFIDKKHRKKNVIYSYIEGERGVIDYGDLVEMADRLANLFRKNGIEPYDLDRRQFVVTDTSDGKIVYLIDIEGYRKKAVTPLGI